MDFSQLDDQSLQTEGTAFVKPDPPPLVPGRVLHSDADFFAYQCGYKFEEESLEQSIDALRLTIQSHRIMAGAEQTCLHLTMGDKGGRYEIARVQEYQKVRENRPDGLRERVGQLRNWMANCTDEHVVPVAHVDQEADDGLCQVMWAAHRKDDGHRHVMWSRDKDLWMVGGLHLNPDTYEIEEYPWGFGSCELSEDRKKVVGQGTSFFWHQMLMGDKADHIPGLPMFSEEIVVKHWPTKALTNAYARLKSAKTSQKAAQARKAIDRELDKVKPKTVGPVKAYEYLRHCKTDKQAFIAVRDAYCAHYPALQDYTCWDGKTEQLTPGHMFIEQARLLWMRRTKGQDVVDWLREVSE